MLYEFLRAIIVFFLRILFKFRVEGKENIPRGSSFILASNHLSNLDPVVLGAASPVRVYFMAKNELFKNRYFASFLKKLGAFPLERDMPDVSALKQAIRLLKSNKPVVIFPQGRRGDISVKPLGGVGFLFKKTHKPIIMAKIAGTDKVLPKGSKMIKLHKITVSFRILSEQLDGDTYDEIAYKVWDNIKRM